MPDRLTDREILERLHQIQMSIADSRREVAAIKADLVAEKAKIEAVHSLLVGASFVKRTFIGLGMVAGAAGAVATAVATWAGWSR